MEVAFSAYDNEVTRIVLPVQKTHWAEQTLEALFENSAGGFTSFSGVGGWHGEREDIVIYDVPGLPWQAVQRAAEIILLSGETDVYIQVGNRAYWFNQAILRQLEILLRLDGRQLAKPLTSPSPMTMACQKRSANLLNLSPQVETEPLLDEPNSFVEPANLERELERVSETSPKLGKVADPAPTSSIYDRSEAYRFGPSKRR